MTTSHEQPICIARESSRSGCRCIVSNTLGILNVDLPDLRIQQKYPRKETRPFAAPVRPVNTPADPSFKDNWCVCRDFAPTRVLQILRRDKSISDDASLNIPDCLTSLRAPVSMTVASNGANISLALVRNADHFPC